MDEKEKELCREGERGEKKREVYEMEIAQKTIIQTYKENFPNENKGKIFEILIKVCLLCCVYKVHYEI